MCPNWTSKLSKRIVQRFQYNTGYRKWPISSIFFYLVHPIRIRPSTLAQSCPDSCLLGPHSLSPYCLKLLLVFPSPSDVRLRSSLGLPGGPFPSHDPWVYRTSGYLVTVEKKIEKKTHLQDTEADLLEKLLLIFNFKFFKNFIAQSRIHQKLKPVSQSNCSVYLPVVRSKRALTNQSEASMAESSL